MNRTRSVCIGVGFLIALGSVATARTGETPRGTFELAGPPAVIDAIVESVNGQVQYKGENDHKWQTLVAGGSLPAGSMIRTGLRSDVVVKMPDGQHVEIGSVTRCTLEQAVFATGQIRSTLAIDNADLDSRLLRPGVRRFDVVVPQPTVGVQLRTDDRGNTRGQDRGRFALPDRAISGR